MMERVRSSAMLLSLRGAGVRSVLMNDFLALNAQNLRF
jgi:hypothetical protein